jgi:hypothetical protein
MAPMDVTAIAVALVALMVETCVGVWLIVHTPAPLMPSAATDFRVQASALILPLWSTIATQTSPQQIKDIVLLSGDALLPTRLTNGVFYRTKNSR